MQEKNDILPLISIIIPVYNTGQYLDKCMESICAQTYRNIEMILVDDGATDGSGAKCDEWAAKDARVRVVHKQNGGLSDARNAGLNVATGEYIGFVDSDDWIEPDMYKFLYDNAVELDADIVECSFWKTYETKEKPARGAYGKTRVFGREEAQIMLMQDRIVRNYVWSKLYRRELMEGIAFPVGKVFEDILFTYKVYDKAEHVAFCPEPKYHYVIRGGSITSKRYEIKNNLDYLEALDTKMKEMIGRGYPEAEDIYLKALIKPVRRLIMYGCPDAMLQKRLELCRRCGGPSLRKLGPLNVWRIWMIRHHLDAFKRLSALSKALFYRGKG